MRIQTAVVRATALAALLAVPAFAGSDRSAASAAGPRAARTGGQNPAGAEPSSIVLVPHLGPAERAARVQAERERRAAAGPLLTAWCRGYRTALAPLTAATREALASLRVAWGPASRGLGYPITQAAATLRAASLPAPDPTLDRQLQSALRLLEDGAGACLQGMPTTAQLGLGAGLQRLAEAEATLAVYAAEGFRCEAATAPR
jgi:hypothetical protein